MIKLVVVDDHVAVRQGLVLLVEQAGIDVVGTATGTLAGLDTVRHAEPDVALVSTSLSDGDATVLTRELIAQSPSLKVVIYSDDTGTESVYEAIGSGASGYALKRGSLDELVAAIEQVAEGGSYIDPRLDHKVAAQSSGARTRLSPREGEVLTLIAHGLSAEAAGERLGVSVETVRTHTRNAVRKLSAKNRTHAIALGLVRGEIQLDEGD